MRLLVRLRGERICLDESYGQNTLFSNHEKSSWFADTPRRPNPRDPVSVGPNSWFQGRRRIPVVGS